MKRHERILREDALERSGLYERQLLSPLFSPPLLVFLSSQDPSLRMTAEITVSKRSIFFGGRRVPQIPPFLSFLSPLLPAVGLQDGTFGV